MQIVLAWMARLSVLMMHAMARTLLISLRYRVQLLLSYEDEVCKTVRVVIRLTFDRMSSSLTCM